MWERKFLGFRLDREKRIVIAPESLERLKGKVRELWDGRRSVTSNQLRDDWNRYVLGWPGYFRFAEVWTPVDRLMPWMRRHIRKCFWLRWHNTAGRRRKLRALGMGAGHYGDRSGGRQQLARRLEHRETARVAQGTQ